MNLKIVIKDQENNCLEIGVVLLNVLWDYTILCQCIGASYCALHALGTYITSLTSIRDFLCESFLECVYVLAHDMTHAKMLNLQKASLLVSSY